MIKSFLIRKIINTFNKSILNFNIMTREQFLQFIENYDRLDPLQKVIFDVKHTHGITLEEPNGLCEEFYTEQGLELDYTPEELDGLQLHLFDSNIDVGKIIANAPIDLSDLMLLATMFKVNKDEPATLLFNFLFNHKEYFPFDLADAGWSEDQIKRAKALKSIIFSGKTLTKYSKTFNEVKEHQLFFNLIAKEAHLILCNDLGMRRQKLVGKYTPIV